MKCVDCDYENNGKHATRAVSLHRKRIHQNFGTELRRAKLKFFDLLELTGNWHNAALAGDELDIWPEGVRPDDATLRRWYLDWEDNLEQGIRTSFYEERAKRVARQLDNLQKFKGRQMAGRYAEAGIAHAGKIIAGKLPVKQQVAYKYLADGYAMIIRENTAAFRAPREEGGTKIGNLIINAGERPALAEGPSGPAAQPTEVIIEAEVNELDAG